MGGISRTVIEESEKKFEWVVAFMAFQDPFTHEILMLMNKRPTTQIPTMGVEVKESGLVLHYNPEYFNALSLEEQRWVFMHEVFHVVLHHCTNRRPADPTQMQLFNVACDLTVNSLIEKSGSLKAPPGVLFPKQFKFPEKLSVEQYMDLLRDFIQPDKQKGPGKEKGDGEPQDDEGDGELQGNEESEDGEEQEGNGKSKGNGEPNLEGGQWDDHSMWNESEIVSQDIRNAIEYIKNTNKWGSVGGDAQSIIEAAQRPQINWRGLLRHYLGQIPSPYRTPTFRKPNRRHGWPYSGQKRLYVNKALFAIDTSGSIEDHNLSQFLAELNKYVEQYPADLVLWDTRITYGPKPFGRKNPKFTFSGRGGTDPSDVIDLAEERGYKTIVFLTDGAFSTPRQPKCDVVWVITEDGNKPVDWGKHVQLYHKNGRRRKNDDD